MSNETASATSVRTQPLEWERVWLAARERGDAEALLGLVSPAPAWLSPELQPRLWLGVLSATRPDHSSRQHVLEAMHRVMGRDEAVWEGLMELVGDHDRSVLSAIRALTLASSDGRDPAALVALAEETLGVLPARGYAALKILCWSWIGRGRPHRAMECVERMEALWPEVTSTHFSELAEEHALALYAEAGLHEAVVHRLRDRAIAHPDAPGLVRAGWWLKVATHAAQSRDADVRALALPSLEAALQAAPANKAQVLEVAGRVRDSGSVSGEGLLTFMLALARDLGNDGLRLGLLDALTAQPLDARERSAYAWEAWTLAQRMAEAPPALAARAAEVGVLATDRLKELLEALWPRTKDAREGALWREVVDRLVRETRCFELVRAHLEADVAAARGGTQEDEARVRLARFLSEELGDAAACIAALGPILADPAWSQRGDVVELVLPCSDALPPSALTTLRDHLAKSQAWDPLASLLARHPEVFGWDGHLELARLHVEALGLPERGERLLASALAKVETWNQASALLSILDRQRAPFPTLYPQALETARAMAPDAHQRDELAARLLALRLENPAARLDALQTLVTSGALDRGHPHHGILCGALRASEGPGPLAAQLTGLDSAALGALMALGASVHEGPTSVAWSAAAGLYRALDEATLRSTYEALLASERLEEAWSLLYAQRMHHPVDQAWWPWLAASQGLVDPDLWLAELLEAFERAPEHDGVGDALFDALQDAGDQEALEAALDKAIRAEGVDAIRMDQLAQRRYALVAASPAAASRQRARSDARALLDQHPTLRVRAQAMDDAREDADWVTLSALIEAGRPTPDSAPLGERIEAAFLLHHRVDRAADAWPWWLAWMEEAAAEDARVPGAAHWFWLSLAEAAKRGSAAQDRMGTLDQSPAFPALRAALGDVTDAALEAGDADAARHLAEWARLVDDGSDLPWWETAVRAARLAGDEARERGALRDWLEQRGVEHFPVDEACRLVALDLASGAEDAAKRLLAAVTAHAPDEMEVVLLLEELVPDQRTAVARLVVEAIGDAITEATLRAHYRVADLLHGSGHAEEARGRWMAIAEAAPWEAEVYTSLGVEAIDPVPEDTLTTEERRRLIDACAAQLASAEGARALALRRTLAALVEDVALRRAHLEAIVEQAPGDVTALRALMAIAEEAEDNSALVLLLEALGRVASLPTAQRLRHLKRGARLALQTLHDPVVAARLLDPVFDLDPAESESLVMMEKALRASESHEALCAHLERIAAAASSEEAKVSALREEARLLDEALGRPRDAASVLQRALALEPRNLTMLEDLARIQAGAALWDDHLETLERLADASGLIELKAEVFLRAARVLHDHLSRSEDAMGLIVHAAEVLVLDDEAMTLAEGIAEESKNYRSWALVLRKVADATRDIRRREGLEAKLGLVLDLHLGEHDTALAILEEAFAGSLRPGPLLDALEEVAGRRKQRELLLPHYAAMREARPKDADASWRALDRSADIALRDLGLPDRAFAILAEARRFAPEPEAVDAMLHDIASEHGFWREYVDVLNQRWEEVQDPEEEVRLLVRKAAVELDHLRLTQDAAASLLAALEVDPFATEARERFAALADAQALWPVFVRLFEGLASDAEPTRRKALLLEVARVQGNQLGRADASWETLHALWAEHSGDREILGTMEELARSSANPQPLLDALQAWAALPTLDREERHEALRHFVEAAEAARAPRALADAWHLLAELAPDELPGPLDAALLLEDLGDGAAFFALARSVSLMVGDGGAWRLAWIDLAEERGDAPALAEALAAHLSHHPDDEALRERYERALSEAGAHETLVGVLTARLEQSNEGLEADALACELARLQAETLGDVALALDTLVGVLERFPDATNSRDAALQMAEGAGLWDIYSAIRIQAAAASPEHPDAETWLADAMAMAEEHAESPALAQDVARQWVALMPKSAAAWEACARAEASAEAWTEHVEALVSLAALVDEDHRRALVLLEAALAAETSGAPDADVHTLVQRVLEINEGLPEAWTLRSRLEERSGDAAAAFAAAARAVQAADTLEGDSSRLAHYLMRVAALGAQAEATGEQATAALERALEIPEVRGEAFARLRGELVRAERWERLEALLGRADSVLDDKAARDEARRERALLLAQALDRASEALPLARQLSAEDPGAGEAWLLHGDVAFLASAWDEALSAYSRLLDDDTLGSLPLWVEVALGETAADPRRPRLLARLGTVHEERGAYEEAFDAFGEAVLEAEGYVPAALGLARISLMRDNPAAVRIQVAPLLRNASLAPVTRAHALVLLARASAAEGDETGAWSMLQEARTCAGSDEDALLGVVDALPSMSDTERSVAILHEMMDAATYPASVRSLAAFAAGHLLLPRADRRADVLRSFRQVLTLEGVDAELVRDAVSALVGLVTNDEAVALLGEVLGRVEKPADRVPLLLERAQLQASDADAEQDLMEVLRIDPQEPVALRLIVERKSQRGEHAALAEALYDLLERVDVSQAASRAQLQRLLGQLLVDPLDRPEEARAHLEEVLRVAPEDVQVQTTLFDICTRDRTLDVDAARELAGHLAQQGVLDTRHLETLTHVASAAEGVDLLVAAMQAKLLVGLASDEELALLGEHESALPRVGPGTLQGKVDETFVASVLLSRPVRDLVAAAAGALAAELPEPSTEGFAPPQESEVWTAARRSIERATGQSPPIWVDPQARLPIRVVFASKPMLLVAPELAASEDEGLVRFALGLGSTLARPEYAVTYALEGLDWLLFLEAALAPARSDRPTFDESMAARYEEWLVRVGGADRPKRVTRVPRALLPDAKRYREDTLAIASQIGLLVSGDVVAGFSLLGVLCGEEIPAQGMASWQAATRRHPALGSTLGFFLSARYPRALAALGGGGPAGAAGPAPDA